MEILEERKGNTLILKLVDRLDTSTAGEFEQRVVELLASGERSFVIDFERLDYMSSAGLRVLLMLAKKLDAAGGKLVLCGMNPSIQQVFEIAGFTRLFSIVGSQTEALESSGRAKT